MVPHVTPMILNNIGPVGLIVILVVVLLLFGRGKIPALMGDVAKGIKSFKKGMKEEPEEAEAKLENQGEDAIDVTPSKKEEGKA